MQTLAQAITEGFELINESAMKATELLKRVKADSDWNDLADTMRVVKGDLEVADSFFYGGDKAMDSLKANWSPGGTYTKAFKDEFGVELEIIDSFKENKASGAWYKKNIGTDGIVSVTLKIK